MKPWEEYRQQQAPQSDGPWSQFAAPTLENAVAATPEVGALSVPTPPQRSGMTRFQDAFTESVLGIPRGLQQMAIQAGGSPEQIAENQVETDVRRGQYNQDIGTLPGFAGAVAGQVVGGAGLYGLAGKIPRVGKAIQTAMLPTTVGRSAVVGGANAGLQPVTSDENRYANAGMGGVGGMAGYGMGKGLQALLDRMTGGQISRNIADRELRAAAGRSNGDLSQGAAGQINVSAEALDAALQGSGVRFAELPADSQQLVKQYVAQAIATGGKVSPTEAAREALTKSLPVPIPNLTRGQRTQDYAQQDTEGVLANTSAGAPIRNLRNNQRDLLAANVDKVFEPFGEAVSPQLMGQQVRDEVLTKRNAAAAGVRALYQEAEGKAGGKIVQPTALVDFFDSNAGLEGIGELLNRAKALKIVSTDAGGNLVANAVPLAKLNDLRRSATVVGSGSDPTKGFFAGKTKGVIDDIVSQEGGDAYSAAIAARRKMGAEFDNNKGVGGLLKKSGGKFGQDFALADEKVFGQIIKNGSIADLKNFVSLNPATLSQVRANLGSHLRETMVGEVNGTKTISLLALEREMAKIGPDKLKMILGDDAHAQLNQIVSAARLIERKQPDLAGGSQSAARLMNLGTMAGGILERVAGAVPVVGNYAAAGVKHAGEVAKTKAALTPTNIPGELARGSRTVKNRNALSTVLGSAALPSYQNAKAD